MASLTNVTLAPGNDMGPPRNNVIYACNICDKSYDKKSSYQSHMRLKHKPTKESEVEKGDKAPQRKSDRVLWIENEFDRPLILTRELDSFQDSRSDASLVVAAKESEEAKVQVERLVVRNHELDWFEEDNGVQFNAEISSEFASSLRSDSLPSQPAGSNVVGFQNELMKKQMEKYDAMVVRTTNMLSTAELSKKDLRNRVKALEKELEEKQENWQISSEAESEDIASLKATIVAQNIKIEELELAANVPDKINVHKCGKCGIATVDNNALTQHMKSAHGEKKGKKSPKCPQVNVNKKLFRMHIKNHKSGTEYLCDICQKTFKSLNDARTHSRKACGKITQKEVVIDIKEVEENHRCNACSTSYNSNKELEKHMDRQHAVDCSKCQITFKSQEDVYKHANTCSEVIEPIMCDKCDRELITKAGLEKHRERCKGDARPSSSNKSKQKQSKEKCINGPKCKFLKENRCLFVHIEENKKHSGRDHRINTELNCYVCKEKINNQQEKHTHKCQHEKKSLQERRKKPECNRGPSCFRLAEGSCLFKHSSVLQRKTQQGQRSAETKTLWCKYQDQCTTRNCSYRHFEMDFQTRSHAQRN